MQELHRRLGNPQLAQDLPGTLLMKVASDYVKHLEKRNEIEQAKLEQEHEDPLVVVAQPGLPWEMRFEIINDYTDELETQWRAASVIMVELLAEYDEIKKKEEGGGDDPVVLPEGQALDAEGGVVPDVREDADVQQEPADSDAEQPPVPAEGQGDG